MGGQVLGFDLQRQASQRAAVPAARFHQPLTVAGEDGEDPVDRVAARRQSRLHDHRLQPLQVTVQDRQQQSFLAGKEMVEAAGVGLRPMQNLGHPGSRVAALPEQIPRRIQQPAAS